MEQEQTEGTEGAKILTTDGRGFNRSKRRERSGNLMKLQPTHGLEPLDLPVRERSVVCHVAAIPDNSLARVAAVSCLVTAQPEMIEHEQKVCESVENSSAAENELSGFGKRSVLLEDHHSTLTAVMEDQHVANDLLVTGEKLVSLH